MRDHLIVEEQGLHTLTGGKGTTFRLMGLDLLERLARDLSLLPPATAPPSWGRGPGLPCLLPVGDHMLPPLGWYDPRKQALLSEAEKVLPALC